jgi:hypothetical protein
MIDKGCGDRLRTDSEISSKIESYWTAFTNKRDDHILRKGKDM